LVFSAPYSGGVRVIHSGASNALVAAVQDQAEYLCCKREGQQGMGSHLG
jgi:hypothetical protein